jgi:hypothetical protein
MTGRLITLEADIDIYGCCSDGRDDEDGSAVRSLGIIATPKQPMYSRFWVDVVKLVTHSEEVVHRRMQK